MGFRKSIQAEFAAKGLLPRFLLFYQNDPGEFKREWNQDRIDSLQKQIESFVSGILSVPKVPHESYKKDLLKPEDKPRWQPLEVPWTKAAEKAWINQLQEQAL